MKTHEEIEVTEAQLPPIEFVIVPELKEVKTQSRKMAAPTQYRKLRAYDKIQVPVIVYEPRFICDDKDHPYHRVQEECCHYRADLEDEEEEEKMTGEEFQKHYNPVLGESMRNFIKE